MYMGMVIFVTWVALTPWILLYGAYEGPKVFWFWIGGFFLTLMWITVLLKSEKISVPVRDVWLLVWIGILSVASLVGIHPLDSFIGGGYRHQGVLFFFTLFLVLETLRRVTSENKKLLVGLLGAGVAFESVIILIQKLGDMSGRPLGTFGEPNAVAGFLAIGLYWIFRMPQIAGNLKKICSALVIAAIIATESRTGLAVAFIVCVASGFPMTAVGKHINTKRILYFSGLLLAGIACIVLMRGIFEKRPASNYESRPLYWQLGLQALSLSPDLGYGAESEEVIYEKRYARMNVRLIDLTIDRSHNIFLDVALWSGVIGLFVFCGWLVGMGREYIVSGDYRRFFVFISWIVFASVQPLGVVHWVYLVLLAASV